MIFIRSLIFNIIFVIANVVLCVGLLWCLIIPRKFAIKGMLIYFKSIHFLEKHILGLDFKVEGMENIPKDGSYIIAMKHQSTYETFKAFMIFGYVAIIMKRELGWIPFWGWYAIKTRMIFVDRGARGKAVQSILDNSKPVIDEGRPILIYPQGTRVSVTDTIKDKPYKQGSTRLYEAYDIPIVPVAMNSGAFWPKGSFLKKGGIVTFKVMPPIPAGLDPKEAFTQMRDILEDESNKLL